MTQLLVSVRNAVEAETALAGGAHLIDVKDPARGSLGRAPDAAITEVLRVVGGRRPVSAALGELRESDHVPTACGLAYVKWGLAGFRDRGNDWQGRHEDAADRVRMQAPGCCAVLVAYADWPLAQAPSVEDVCAYACQRCRGPLLVDTFCKDGRTLLDHLSLREVLRLCRRCRDAGVPVALAGSLGLEQIEKLRVAEPDWFAVRGAVCRRGQRQAAIDAGKIRMLADLLRASIAAG